MTLPAIYVENLTRYFGDFLAVDHVSFDIQPGEIVGFVGPNGSGKTTTIRMLLGLLRPTSGRADLLALDSQRQTEAIRPLVGYMSQKAALYDELSIAENLTFYAVMISFLRYRILTYQHDYTGRKISPLS